MWRKKSRNPLKRIPRFKQQQKTPELSRRGIKWVQWKSYLAGKNPKLRGNLDSSSLKSSARNRKCSAKKNRNVTREIENIPRESQNLSRNTYFHLLFQLLLKNHRWKPPIISVGLDFSSVFRFEFSSNHKSVQVVQKLCVYIFIFIKTQI